MKVVKLPTIEYRYEGVRDGLHCYTVVVAGRVVGKEWGFTKNEALSLAMALGARHAAGKVEP